MSRWEEPEYVKWVVTIDFLLYGFVGREKVIVVADNQEYAEAIACNEVSMDAISMGAASWPCGCCCKEIRRLAATAQPLQD